MKFSESGFGISMVLFALCSAGAVLSANGCVEDNPNNVVVPVVVPSTEPLNSNIMKVTVNGSLCGPRSQQYANEPCVSVKLCPTGGGDCQTIDNVLLDTGSYGLRLYRSVISAPLITPIAVTGGNLAECVQFGDNSSEWGQVEYANVVLASEAAVRVPIMVIDSTYAKAPGPCSASQSRPDISPAETGFNGILGVGLLSVDCGLDCSGNKGNEQYYACTSTSCAPSIASLEQQVSNPVASLSQDNNGVILDLPTVASAAATLGRTSSAQSQNGGADAALSSNITDGATALEGRLILGIGTQPNNQVAPGEVTTFEASSYSDFLTVFSDFSPSAKITSFIDSGSSALFFPPPADTSLPDCGTAAGGGLAGYAGFYCPASPVSFTATNFAADSSSSGSAAFSVSNAAGLFGTGNLVFATLGDSSTVSSDTVFDWGLPFFYGKKVYVGITGTESPLANSTDPGLAIKAGPYWAY